MAEVSKIKLPDDSVVDIKDARIPGVDSSPTSGSSNVLTSGGAYTAISGKQDTLVSGTNLKTVNNVSLLGSGNVDISGVDTYVDVQTKTLVCANVAHQTGGGGDGTVTSVAMTVPTGLSVSGSPITTSGTLAVSFASGYSIPTTTKQGQWDAKQDALISGTSIKTVNSKSLLGSGNITTGTYSKPSGGIPSTDLASAVQTSLGKADTALQSFTETDPVFTASAAHGISSTDISNWNAKQKAITVSSSAPTSSQGSNGDIWIVI